tara:strand:- start:255 stop:500 length:246 start_codon:yes stop_codon:yes gene_type:complete
MKKNELDIIGMAWEDKISFDEIKKKTGYSEKEIINIMRKKLKKNSYILWRKRVRGRLTKHRKLIKFRSPNFSRKSILKSEY